MGMVVRNYLVVIRNRIKMSFNPSDPAITQQIADQVSTMVASFNAKTAFAAEQQKRAYIQAQSKQIFNAYIQQIPVVGQTQLDDLNVYHGVITSHQATVAGAISTLSQQLATVDMVHFSSFSTLLTMPYTPTSLTQYFANE